MSGTLNSQAIKVANNIMALAQQQISVYQQIVAMDAAWADISAATVIAAMATAAVNADGQIGTADGSPSATHPINTTIFPALAQAVSSTQITQAKSILDAIRSLIEGNAVSAQGGARAILNAMING